MRRWRVGVHQLTISSSPAVHVAKQRGLPYLLKQLKGKVELLAQEGVGDMSESSKADIERSLHSDVLLTRNHCE